MFDIEVHQHRHVTERVTQNVNIQEHRAPTDQSVQLLREFEQAARDKVIDSIRLENMPLDAVLHVEEDGLNDKMRYLIVYKIGGEKRKVFHDEPRHGFKHPRDEQEKRVIGLRDALAKDVANVLMDEMLRNAERLFNGLPRV
jgi:ABC-type bacteriocin/lantibiotic exporter with double-glycine peptidase domain